MEIFITNYQETLLLIILLLIISDVIFCYEYPTQVAYILITSLIIIKIKPPVLTSILLAVIVWFALMVFHYTIWRKQIEKLHDKIISPRKHMGGIEKFIGMEGKIKEVEGELFIEVGKEIYQFESKEKEEVKEGESHVVINVKSSKLII